MSKREIPSDPIFNPLTTTLLSDTKQFRKNLDVGITGSREEDDFTDEDEEEVRGLGGLLGWMGGGGWKCGGRSGTI